MAEGEEPFCYDFPVHDDNYAEEQEVDTTRPFFPGASSTPYHVGEQYEMQTMMHEQSGLPSYDDERIPLLSHDKDAKL